MLLPSSSVYPLLAPSNKKKILSWLVIVTHRTDVYYHSIKLTRRKFNSRRLHHIRMMHERSIHLTKINTHRVRNQKKKKNHHLLECPMKLLNPVQRYSAFVCAPWFCSLRAYHHGELISWLFWSHHLARCEINSTVAEKLPGNCATTLGVLRLQASNASTTRIG